MLWGQRHDIYITTYDTLDWLYFQLRQSKGTAAPFKHLILDESHKVRDPSTTRWKRLRKMAPMFGRRILLTGTPLGGGRLDGLWSQMFLLDKGDALGTDFTTFQSRYFRKVNDYKWEPWPETEEILWNVLKGHCLSMRSFDLIDMPELIRNEIKIELPEKAREAYRAIEKDFFLEIKPGLVVLPPTAAVS